MYNFYKLKHMRICKHFHGYTDNNEQISFFCKNEKTGISRNNTHYVGRKIFQ